MRALTHFTRRVLSVGASAALLSSCGGFSAAVTPGDRNEALQPEAVQKTFYYTGHAERFVVPSGVTTIEVDAIGAAGGGIRYPKYCYGPCFGRGGRIEAEIPVRPGETLYVRVGGKGLRAPSGDAGGFNGGGTGGNGGYWGGNGGGGASDVREGGDKLKDRILVAGGGGAEGTGHLSFQCCNGGDGGGTVGGDGGFGSMKGGGGSGGSQTEGGGGGKGNVGYGSHSGQPGANGVNGTLGSGGPGGAGGQGGSFGAGGGGGGGGGGYYGGGGGGGGVGSYGFAQSGGGGGGGSSYIEPKATHAKTWQGWKPAVHDGRIVFSW